jgi:hypothetical protein
VTVVAVSVPTLVQRRSHPVAAAGVVVVVTVAFVVVVVAVGTVVGPVAEHHPSCTNMNLLYWVKYLEIEMC